MNKEIDNSIHLDNDKYTYIRYKNGTQVALRNGDIWRDLTGDKFILSMAFRIEELEKEIYNLTKGKIV